MSPALLWVLTLGLFALGMVGIFIPALPGLMFIFAGVLLYAWATNFTVISTTTVIILGIVALVAWLSEYISSGIAAKVAGGRRRAFWGTIIGSLIGGFMGPLGLVGGAFIGALLGALSEGHRAEHAGYIAAVSVVGVLGATLIQVAFGIVMIIAFFSAVLWG